MEQLRKALHFGQLRLIQSVVIIIVFLHKLEEVLVEGSVFALI
jgi:hypothetical protein